MSVSRPTHYNPHDFSARHIGPRKHELSAMLASLGYDSLDALANAAVPESIRLPGELQLPAPLSEQAALAQLKSLAQQNKVLRSWLGMGYASAVVPGVIKRNILENPGWYTQYTPYQPEISQGRLEALLNFQTMVTEMTGLPIANASLLDEGTAAAEAMSLSHAVKNRDGSKAFFVAETCHPQVLEVVKGRAEALGIDVIVGDPQRFDFKSAVFGVLLPYPDTKGEVQSYRKFIETAHQNDALVTMAVDLLALALLVPPGELGADIAIGNSQRFGVPLGYGGPHAAFFATHDEHKRRVPGRMVGVSKDRHGRTALRLALQTREQHIRREKATSNICTAQALLANMAGMYAVYHGSEGIKAIAERVHQMTGLLAAGLEALGQKVATRAYFDTITLTLPAANAAMYQAKALAAGINLRLLDAREIGIAFDETTTTADVEALWAVFAGAGQKLPSVASLLPQVTSSIPRELSRQSAFLKHPVFERYRSETELMRYIKRLEQKDLSLTSSMIPLGSCTMKLNAASELEPISWPEFASLHPFVPADQAQGYHKMFAELEAMLAEVTGYAAVSLQPNSGAQGEYAGLLVIKAYHQAQGQGHRNVCLIPTSAHGTNPASAALAGFKVVAVQCDKQGNIDLADLKAKAAEHTNDLAAIMVTYPSTHGVFETEIKQVCQVIHQHGGQVYLDGANLNAQLGLCAPGKFGADVSHLNLHKTFCIPHGGGGPGMGPIAVGAHLAPYLPGHPVVKTGGSRAIKAISAAPWGSAGILPIPWMYMRMMGGAGLKRATQVAILNANYIAKRLAPHYPILYRGPAGLVAHECIIDLRPLKVSSGVEVVDIAKRLMDFGYHSPTMAFPVAGTMMIEPTESESQAELDRFCEAMIAIRQEISAIEKGQSDRNRNALKQAPHTASELCRDAWDHPYSRQDAAFPAAWLHEHKYWPTVGRIDEAYGDRFFMCTCPSVEEWA